MSTKLYALIQPLAAADLVGSPEFKRGARAPILLAEDQDMVRQAIRLILASRGYPIVEAWDGEDAVAKYVQSSPRPGLVIMDIDMPRLDGWQALSRMRQHDGTVKAIMLSGALCEGERPIDLRGVKFLQKPFDNQELLALAKEMLEQRCPG